MAILLAAGAEASRLEWNAPRDLTLSGGAELKLKGAKLREWRADGREEWVGVEAVAEGEVWRLRAARELDIHAQHELRLKDDSRLPVIPAGVLDSFVCSQPLGRCGRDSSTVFRVFAPRATALTLHLYAKPGDDKALLSRDAQAAEDGSWSVACPEARDGMAWTWSLASPTGVRDWTDKTLEFADPWATAVATRNEPGQPGRALLLDENYAWKRADWRPPDPASLIIAEAHLRDMTAGIGAGAGAHAGDYRGFWSAGSSGLAHLRELGASAVEFLPLQEFGNIEPPYQDRSQPIVNTWNPYARNHWGYMTSAFLAPEACYASGQDLKAGGWCGLEGRQVAELKELVDHCHAAGLAVILDVVYNHVSQYDRNPLKCLDMAYWFRLNDDGTLASTSGCGNDLATERPLARRLILDSVRHFAQDYRVDGFRFDLGAMLDDETLSLLHAEMTQRGLFHCAEPWGGGQYEPATFARLGWAWWNDQYRVDLRGRQPAEATGFLFGRMHSESSPERLAQAVMGYAAGGGVNPSPLQSVNYVAAHDDHDLGDWIKIALGVADGESPVADPLAYQTLTPAELAVHGVAALHLLSSAGVPMIHAGQELGRCKIIAPGCPGETRTGRVDHNSYEKDNATNWIDWRLKRLNAPLFALYREAVAFRRAHPELATASRQVLGEPGGAHLAWTSAEAGVAAAFNTDPAAEWRLALPGQGVVKVTSGTARLEAGSLVLGPRSAALLEWNP